MHSMQCATRDFLCHLPFPDSGDEHVAFRLSGGTEEVKKVATRHAGWHGKALIPLTGISIFSAFILHGWLAALACFGAAAIGSAIFWLAQRSLHRQEKAGKAVDAAEASNRFETKVLFFSLRSANLLISSLITISRAATLMVRQRLFEGLAGLVHLALSKRLLPIPFRPR